MKTPLKALSIITAKQVLCPHNNKVLIIDKNVELFIRFNALVC